MREITGHRVNECNRGIRVFASDALTAGGAPKSYHVDVDLKEEGYTLGTTLEFHEGNPAEVGTTGMTNEALLEVLIDRLSSFQAGPFCCHENNEALASLQEAKMWLNRRTAQREARGVEGQAVP